MQFVMSVSLRLRRWRFAVRDVIRELYLFNCRKVPESTLNWRLGIVGYASRVDVQLKLSRCWYLEATVSCQQAPRKNGCSLRKGVAGETRAKLRW